MNWAAFTIAVAHVVGFASAIGAIACAVCFFSYGEVKRGLASTVSLILLCALSVGVIAGLS